MVYSVSRADALSKAMLLRRWAEETGAFSQGRAAGTYLPQVEAASAPSMFSAAASRAFAAKPITAIGVAASTRREARIFIYTRRKLTKIEQAKLTADSKLDLPVEFKVARPFSIQAPSSAPQMVDMFRKKRLACGSSISVGNTREAGTLGALLRDGNGKLFGLSCNHVTGGCSNARLNVPIVSPGIMDVTANGPHPRTIGFHAKTLQFIAGDPSSVPGYKSNLDSAVFEIGNESDVTSWQGNAFDTPSAVLDPEEDAPIEKVGRTTRHTRGVVESQLVGPQRIDYDLTVFHSAEENIAFRGTVFFEPVYMLRGIGGDFAIEGDSGALVVTREQGKDAAAIGIVVGGHAGETFMLPLRPILSKLGMTLVSGHE